MEQNKILIDKEHERRSKDLYEKEKEKTGEVKDIELHLVSKPQLKIIYKSSLITFNDVINDEYDVEKVVNELREILLKELKEKGQIRLI